MQQSLQVLTDEEKFCWRSGNISRKDFQWVTRSEELVREQQRVASLAQQAQQALADAAPELARLQLAQPANQLRPLWDRQQEQTARPAQTKQRIIEVNTRLHAKTSLRARIRNGALRSHEQLQTELTALAQWLAEHDRFRLWGRDCGLARTFSQRSRDKHQLTALAARIAELRQKLAALPENALTLTADEVAVAMEQQAQSRAFRQRLTSLHARYQPLQNVCVRTVKACKSAGAAGRAQ